MHTDGDIVATVDHHLVDSPSANSLAGSAISTEKITSAGSLSGLSNPELPAKNSHSAPVPTATPSAELLKATAQGSQFYDSNGVKTTRAVALFAGDVLILSLITIAAWLSSVQLRGLLNLDSASMALPNSNAVAFVMIVLPVVLLLFKSYKAGHYTRFKPLWTETKEYFSISLYTVSLIAIILYFADSHFSRLWFVSFWTLILVTLPITRLLVKHQLQKQNKWFVPVVIFGTGRNAYKCARNISNDDSLGQKVVAFVHYSQTPIAETCQVPRDRVLALKDFDSIVGLEYASVHYLFAPDKVEELEQNRTLLDQLSSSTDSVTIAPPLYGLPLDGAEIVNIPRSDSVLLRLQNKLAKPHNAILKRIADLVVSLLAITALMPMFIILYLLVKRDGGPAFYRQSRIGEGGKTFSCWKFRSMALDADRILSEHLAANESARAEWANDHKLRNDPRITPIGAFIRKGSIDELPQLWNVLKGDMSLVGPRPIVLEERTRYGELYGYYLNQKPGITGLWQISGRNHTTYNERVALDVWYSRNWSFWLDIIIVVRTFPVVFSRSGAY